MRGGLCDDLANWTDVHNADAKQLGCDVARVPIGYNRPEDPAVSTGIEAIRRARMRPMICVWFHTDFPPTVEVYRDHAVRFAELWPQSMIQLLNEPNHESFGNLNPQQAAEYIIAAARAIRSLFPDQKLIAAAPTPGKPGWRDYFRAMHDAIPRALDVDPALHVYPASKEPIRQIVTDYRMAAKYGPVHVTQLGYQAHIYGPERQAQLTEATLRRLGQLGASTTVLYRLARPIDQSEWEDRAQLSVLDQMRLRQAFREGVK